MPEDRTVGVLDLVVFLAELVLLGALATAGARLGDGPSGVALGIALPVAAAVAWGLGLAPRAERRLPHPARLVAKLVLALVAAVLLAASGAPGPAAAVLVVVGGLFVAGDLREAAAGRR